MRVHTHSDMYMLIMSNKPVCKSTFISFKYILQEGNSSWKVHARAQGIISQKRKQKEVEARGWGKNIAKCYLLDVTWTHELTTAKSPSQALGEKLKRPQI